MDKDRIEGVAHQVEGAVKEKAGKALGDTKLETEGQGEKVAGKIQKCGRRHEGRPEGKISFQIRILQGKPGVIRRPFRFAASCLGG